MKTLHKQARKVRIKRVDNPTRTHRAPRNTPNAAATALSMSFRGDRTWTPGATVGDHVGTPRRLL
jgi:hypothetical protein